MGRQRPGPLAASPASGLSPGAAPVRLLPKIRAKESTLVITFMFYPTGIRDHLKISGSMIISMFFKSKEHFKKKFITYF